MTTEEGDIVIKSGTKSITIEAKGKITLKSDEGVVIDAPALDIAKGGKGTLDLLADASAWKAELAGHTHEVPVPVHPAGTTASGPPVSLKSAVEPALLTSATSCTIKVK